MLQFCICLAEEVFRQGGHEIAGVATENGEGRGGLSPATGESTDELKLRLEKCLIGFAMWGLQTMKWLKLDLLERRLMSTKASGSVGQKQIVEIVKTFS
ncbi:hypothetical protein AXG93_3671s1020 [Marchantia polymorpha subsp. ruderalis]|uniref:Uncharacterized protein n=1 Tax=Marchantia polymorpha subsp. ruderalis TaxID=1480154 RepID=A0A176WIB6_MARPO|nr:hypothetical protein AXG93_3671s1020 [Marchantia polymorpha subsp. ruderalis]